MVFGNIKWELIVQLLAEIRNQLLGNSKKAFWGIQRLKYLI